MANVSNSSDLTNPLSKSVPFALAILIGISLIGWLIQTIQIHFRPIRLMFLIVMSHLTLLIELILRIVYSNDASKTSTVYMAFAALLTISERTMILANYDFVLRWSELTSCLIRTVTVTSVLVAVTSAFMMSISTRMLYNTGEIDRGFQLRQISCALIFALTILFYPIWFAAKPLVNKKKSPINLLLIISSLACLMIATYLLITSIPDYYHQTDQHEYWFYIFQIAPHIVALFTWTICHPKRSLKLNQQYNINDGS